MSGLHVDLSGKVAIVTGGASGIGRAIAEALASSGAAVCASDINEQGAREVVAEMEGRGARGLARTPLVEGQIADQARVHRIPQEDVVAKLMLAPAAIKRLLEPAEIADLALYLCSDAAAGVTGSAFPIDAGWTAR